MQSYLSTGKNKVINYLKFKNKHQMKKLKTILYVAFGFFVLPTISITFCWSINYFLSWLFDCTIETVNNSGIWIPWSIFILVLWMVYFSDFTENITNNDN